MQALKTKLRLFKLSGIANSIEDRLRFARDTSLGYEEFIELLLQDEHDSRMSNSYKKRLTQAKLPCQKRIEDFDFSFQPSIDKKIVNDCMTCSFIRDKRNIVFIGNPGTGKTHLSISLALNALAKGFKVLFTSVAEMIALLHTSKADNTYFQKIQFFLRPDLLILDELGFRKLPNYSADDFFEIIAKRYEQGSIIITTNKMFEAWSDIFADSALASAILDRIVHHSIIFKIQGPSYRAKNIKKKGDL